MDRVLVVSTSRPLADLRRPGALEALGLVPVCCPDEAEGAAADALWALLHSRTSALPLESDALEAWRNASQRVAQAVAASYCQGDRIWLVGSGFMLVPRLVRALLPVAPIGFFLDAPFPPPEAFEASPAAPELLEGLLASDLIGFAAPSHLRNFSATALHVLGAGIEVEAVHWQGQVANLGVFPVGVDAGRCQALAESEAVQSLSRSFRVPPGHTLVVGIDALDETRGIVRRLLAYEALLREHPELAGRVRLVQGVTTLPVGRSEPWREEVERLNARLATPALCLFRPLPEEELLALLGTADVLLVTSPADELGLVARRFVAARSHGDGVLLVSALSSEAIELAEALRFHPGDVEGMAQALHLALTMKDAERKERMAALRRRVSSHDLGRWAGRFVAALSACGNSARRSTFAASTEAEVEVLRDALRGAERLVLLLDYDGTLVPFTDTPAMAVPDDELLALLARLSARPGTEVHIVSGRTSEWLEGSFGRLEVHLHAEHGQASKAPSGAWKSRDTAPQPWRPKVLEILRDFADRTPGSFVEEKHSGVAWHYRMADAEFGALMVRELVTHLSSVLWNAPVEVLSGNMVVELRPPGANKGRVSSDVVARARPGSLVAAFGDDRTDEDLFAALPPSALTVHVGPSPSQAKLRLPSTAQVRALLGSILREG